MFGAVWSLWCWCAVKLWYHSHTHSHTPWQHITTCDTCIISQPYHVTSLLYHMEFISVIPRLHQTHYSDITPISRHITPISRHITSCSCYLSFHTTRHHIHTARIALLWWYITHITLNHLNIASQSHYTLSRLSHHTLYHIGLTPHFICIIRSTWRPNTP